MADAVTVKVASERLRPPLFASRVMTSSTEKRFVPGAAAVAKSDKLVAVVAAVTVVVLISASDVAVPGVAAMVPDVSRFPVVRMNGSHSLIN